MRILGLLPAALAAACGGGRLAVDGRPAAGPDLQAWVGPGTAVATAPFPGASGRAPCLDGEEALVIGGDGWRVPDCTLGEATRQALRAFLERGGRLLLLGYAASLVHELGIEPRRPDASEPFRWGFDARTAIGRARLGVEVVSGHLPELADGLAPLPGRDHGYALAGGEPCCVPACTWRAAPPARGEVLGRLLVEQDGAPAVRGDAVLAHWTVGAGAVLALGLWPDAESGDATLAQNARAFLLQALRWLGGGRAPRAVAFWPLPDPAPEPLPPALAPFDTRPAAPLLAHWGWEVAAHDPDARSPQQVLEEALLPGWCAGADLLLLDLVDPARGLPLPWPSGDPIAVPADYRGGAFRRDLGADELGALAGEAHARGMLLQGLLDPWPVGDGSAARLATLRFAARQLADLRRLGPRSLDGFWVRDWFDDSFGYGAAMLRDFQPGAAFVRAGEGPRAAGALAALDAADGQPRGICAYGLSAAFRSGFPGDLFPAGILDATARRPPQPGGDLGSCVRGGGSGGDWIAQQAADFVRERRGRGGAMLWRAQAPSVLDDDTVAYVHGVSMEPLVAAIAARCTTLGRDGWRAAQRELLPAAQRGFGAELPVPAATVMLENNHLRLFGSGGALLCDLRGLGRFRDGEALVLATELFRTRLSGCRPAAGDLRGPDVDLLAGGRAGAGGHEAVDGLGIGGAAPAMLAFGRGGQWPARADFAFAAEIGSYELELALRAVSGQGVVTVGLDGERLACLPFQDGRLGVRRTLALRCARGGVRHLQLEVADGGTLALDAVRLHRCGDVGAEAHVVVPAGSRAVLQEHSASSWHDETVEISTLADFPGLLVRSSCTRADSGLQLERRFGLRLHRALRTAAPGDGPRSLRAPFVLAASDAALPDLAVVPLALGRYERFELREGDLVLAGKPEPGAATAFGLCLLARDRAAALLPHLPEVFAAQAQPAVLDLGDLGAAELHGSLPFAWNRVVQVAHAGRTPFLVEEDGWWTWQPGQALADGSQWLRVRQRPDDVVRIVGGPAVLARTRPGPGSLRTVALRAPAPDSVVVRVLQRGGLAPPAVTMAADFDAVTVDGRPWACYRDRTVFLPDRAATYAVATRRHGGDAEPHVLATSARLEHCAFDAERKELVLVARSDPDAPPGLALTAVLAGPSPKSVDGGELVDERELRRGGEAARAAAAAGGVLLRFLPGVVRVRYGDRDGAAPARER